MLTRELLHGRWTVRGRYRGVVVAVTDVVVGLQGAAFAEGDDDGVEPMIVEGVFPEDEVAEVPARLVKELSTTG